MKIIRGTVIPINNENKKFIVTDLFNKKISDFFIVLEQNNLVLKIGTKKFLLKNGNYSTLLRNNYTTFFGLYSFILDKKEDSKIELIIIYLKIYLY